MSININSNIHTQPYHPVTKKGKAETNSFTMPDTDDQTNEQTPLEAFNSYGKGLSDEDFRNIQNDLMSRARVLPPEIMNGNRLDEFIEKNVAKIVFEFGEDGSISIKEGLSKADYERAVATLKDIDFWRRGGTLPPK